MRPPRRADTDDAMVRTLLFSTLIVAQSAGGCLQSLKNAVPTGPTGETVMSGFGGSWASLAASTAAQACTDYAWNVTEWTATSASGTWSARCFSSLPVTGTASAALVDGAVRWTATGTGTAEGVSCPVALAGSAVLEQSQIRIPYSGTTCLGPVAGTEILRK